MKLRLKIQRTQEFASFSHLEYVRTLERAIRRAKLPRAIPKALTAFEVFLASALGVGVTSNAEFAEIELSEPVNLDETVRQLTASLPVGIRILAADIVPAKTAKLMAQAGGADYKIIVPCASCDWEEAIAAFNAAESVPFKKPVPQGRGKTKEIEVKDYIKEIEAEQLGENLCLRFSAGLRPREV
jgi:radical SAM-linked protein